MTATAVPSPLAPSPDVTFPDPGMRAVFASEWLKLWTARAPRRNLVLATVLGIAIPALVALAIGATWDDWDAAGRADFHPLLFPMSGMLLSAIFAVSVGVNVVAGEMSSGMVRLTLAATPRRGRVLAAKALAVAAATGAAGAITLVGMVAATQPILAAYDVPTLDLGTWDTWRALVGIAVTGPVFPVLAVAAGVVLRSSAGAITTIVLFMFAPVMLVGLLPDWWQENVVALLPGVAGDTVSFGHLVPEDAHIHPVTAALAIVAWLAAAFALTHAVWSRRDA
jgi:ABC-type transport system involved in multi-copper enzyme maturation permease subunit